MDDLTYPTTRGTIAAGVAAYYNLPADTATRLVDAAARELRIPAEQDAFTYAEHYALQTLAGNLSDDDAGDLQATAADAPSPAYTQWWADMDAQIIACEEHRTPGMVEVTADDVWELTAMDDVNEHPTPETACQRHHEEAQA